MALLELLGSGSTRSRYQSRAIGSWISLTWMPPRVNKRPDAPLFLGGALLRKATVVMVR